jgi:hypothetical protein
LAVATQRQLDPREDSLVILGWTVIVLEHAGIRSDPMSAFTHHGEAPDCNDSIGVQMDYLLSEKVQNKNEKLAGRKAKPSSKLRLNVDTGCIAYHRKFQISDKRFYLVR